MDSTTAIAALTALAPPTRLQVFRRLVKLHPDESASGVIAGTCKVPHNTMSTHLAVLTRARPLRVCREERMMRYGADLDGFRALVGFLMRDCCNGRAEICAPLMAELNCCPPRAAGRKREKARGSDIYVELHGVALCSGAGTDTWVRLPGRNGPRRSHSVVSVQRHDNSAFSPGADNDH